MKVYVARQPIFEPSGKPFGYEFLYRDGGHNSYNPSVDGTQATCRLISNMVNEFGMENLTGGAYAFVNFTEELLKSEYLKLLDSRRFIVEILETVRADDKLLQQILHLKELGYIFALDDFIGDQERTVLADMADFIKVDFRLTDEAAQKRIARRYSGEKFLLAEKIETQQELDKARAMGYTLYQGYFFSKPVVLSRNATEIATATYMRLWKEISRPSPDFDRLAEIIRLDVNLTYKFLLRVNSLQYYRGHEVKSVKQALIRLGLSEVKRWTLSILIRDMMGEKNNETAKRALIRAEFAESLMVAARKDALTDDAYLVALFSTIDTTLQPDLQELLTQIRVSDAVKEAILERGGVLGGLLDFIDTYETGNWDGVRQFLHDNGLEDKDVSKLYLAAVEYAEQMFGDKLDAPPLNHGLILEQQLMLSRQQPPQGLILNK